MTIIKVVTKVRVVRQHNLKPQLMVAPIPVQLRVPSKLRMKTFIIKMPHVPQKIHISHINEIQIFYHHKGPGWLGLHSDTHINEKAWKPVCQASLRDLMPQFLFFSLYLLVRLLLFNLPIKMFKKST